MNIIKLTLICSIMTIVGCSSSNGSLDINQGTSLTEDDPVNAAANGSITLSAEPSPMLQPLPEVEFNGEFADTSTGTDGRTESLFDDGVALAETSPATTGGTDGGSSDGASIGSGTDAGTTGDAAVSDSYVSTRPGAPTPTTPEQFQAGTLTAADYDDQLNPHLYQSYASAFLQRVGGKLDLPYLDLSNRIALHVEDEFGAPYAGAKIELSDGNNDFLSLTTPASGTTYLYTNVDNLPEQFVLRAVGDTGADVHQTISLTDAYAAGAINIVISDYVPLTDQQSPPTQLDIMFVVDTTGSMGDELNYLQTELTQIINAIPFEKNLLNIGLTFYRDIGDAYVVRAHGFTNDIGMAQQTLNNESYDGGGDYPEAMDQALHQAIDANWSANSNRIVFLIADAPPHGDKMRATWDAATQARLKNIHIVPIAASGVGEDAEYLMRSMAAYTNSRYLFLTDDSGFGNPHAEPNVDCYVVTQLDNLMKRVVNSLVTGYRDEPTDNDIVRRVGDYDQGKCRTGQTTQR